MLPQVMSSETCKYQFKITSGGDSQVGKTALINQYVDKKFTTDFQSTIGMDPKTKILKISDENVKLQIWDMGGQAHFHHIRGVFYNGASGGVFVFDLTRNDTLGNLQTMWYKEYVDNVEKKDKNEADGPFVIMGNKVDLPREVDFETARSIAYQYKSDYVETSAKTGENVNQGFTDLAMKILHKSECEVTSSYVNNFLKTSINKNAQILLLPAPEYEKLTPLEFSHQIFYMDQEQYNTLIQSRAGLNKGTLTNEIAKMNDNEFVGFKKRIISEDGYDRFVKSLSVYQGYMDMTKNLVFIQP